MASTSKHFDVQTVPTTVYTLTPSCLAICLTQWMVPRYSFLPSRPSVWSLTCETDGKRETVEFTATIYTGCRFVRYPQHLWICQAICHKNTKFTSHFVNYTTSCKTTKCCVKLYKTWCKNQRFGTTFCKRQQEKERSAFHGPESNPNPFP